MSGNSVTPRLTELAEQLVGDISVRQLKPGDRYLTTQETSKFLGVGTSTANRVLQLLDRRRVITRQQRRGSYIARLPDSSDVLALRKVHFLVHERFLRTEGVGNDHVLIGMQEELPGVQVQISFLPLSQEQTFVDDLIHASLKGSTVDGFVLVRAGIEIQRSVAASGLPAVVYGSLYPGVGELACFERDMIGVGEKLAAYLLKRGHRRIAYFNRQQTLPGDQATIDGIAAKMGEAGLCTNALTVRFLPSDDDACTAEAARLISSSSPPTGFICRTARMARAVRQSIQQAAIQQAAIQLAAIQQAAIQQAGNLSTDKQEVVVCDYYLRPQERAEFVYARAQLSAEQQGHRIALMLAQQARQSAPNCERTIIPVEISVPA